jgi:hypothetical protein
MKKFILSVLFGLSVSAFAANTITVSVPPLTATNLFSLLNSQGYAKVTAISVTAGTTNTAVTFFDNTTNSLVFTVPAFTNYISYATNFVQTWTNYFGATNYWTNISLVQISNYNAAATISVAKNTVSAIASTTTTLSPTAYIFENGIWVTNLGPINVGTTSGGAATVSITYQ